MKKRFSEDNLKICEDGECIFREGEHSQEMYIVQSGEVVVSKTTLSKQVTLALLKRGDFLGEMSLLESDHRSASAHAKGPTRLLCIQPGGFLLKIRRDPTFAFELMQSLSKRVRKTNERLIDALERGQITSEDIRKILDSGMA